MIISYIQRGPFKQLNEFLEKLKYNKCWGLNLYILEVFHLHMHLVDPNPYWSQALLEITIHQLLLRTNITELNQGHNYYNYYGEHCFGHLLVRVVLIINTHGYKLLWMYIQLIPMVPVVHPEKFKPALRILFIIHDCTFLRWLVCTLINLGIIWGSSANWN